MVLLSSYYGVARCCYGVAWWFLGVAIALLGGCYGVSWCC